MSKLKDYLDKEIKEIESDSRFQDESALIEVNAPLALIQTDLESRRWAFRKCKDILDKDPLLKTAPVLLETGEILAKLIGKFKAFDGSHSKELRQAYYAFSKAIDKAKEVQS